MRRNLQSEGFPRRLSGRSQKSPQQQHLAPPTAAAVAAAVAPHRAEPNLSPPCDALSCAVMPNVEFGEITMEVCGVNHTKWYVCCHRCQVNPLLSVGTGCGRKLRTQKQNKNKLASSKRSYRHTSTAAAEQQQAEQGRAFSY